MQTRFQRILVVKIADLGDTVLVLPALQALRQRFPTARIDLLTSPIGREVAVLCPAIDSVHVLDKARLRSGPGLVTLLRTCWRLARTGYDAVVLLHHLTTGAGRLLYRLVATAARSPVVVGLDNGTGHFLTHPIPDRGFGTLAEWEYALSAVEALGTAPRASGPFLEIPEEARERARDLLASVARPLLVIHPGVGPFAPARQWPATFFAALAQRLIASGYQVVVSGTATEYGAAQVVLDVPGTVDLVGKTSVATLAAVLEEAALVIGADCGVIHLAAALRRPTLALFGPTNVEAWRPLGAAIVTPGDDPPAEASTLALTLRLPCSPCCYVGYRLGRPRGCRVRTCLLRLEPDVVARFALHLLESRAAGPA